MFSKKIENKPNILTNDIQCKAQPIYHPKPWICFFDIGTETVENFSKNSYKCAEGTIGKLIRVPNKQKGDKELLSLNYSTPKNLHEFDILVFDMANNNTEVFYEEDHGFNDVTGQSAYALLSSFPEKIFNPKPYVIDILSNTINDLLKKESVIIIFAGKKEKVNYQIVNITSRGYSLEQQLEIENTCFYNDFPGSYNKFGNKFRLSENKTAISDFLFSNLDECTYELVFFHPKKWENGQSIEDSSFVPLLLNDSGDIVSYIHIYPEGAVLVFPQIKDKNKFLLELFNVYLTELFPKIFPFHGQFSWLDNGSYPLPGEIELREEREEIEKKYKVAINSNDAELITIKEKYSFLRELLSESGVSLVKSVEKYLKWLEFQSVVNLDETSRDVLEEDLQVDYVDKFLVIEVKGIGGTSTDKDCSQISKIKYRRAEQRKKFDVFGLYIVNHQRYTPPERRCNPPFTDNQINDSKLDKRGLITTYELYKAYFMIEQGILTKEYVREKLFETGLISLSPIGLVSIGIPSEYYHKSTIVIVNVENTLIKKGCHILAKKNNSYSKLKIESLKVNEVEVNEIDNGEVGIKFDRKVAKNSELFIIKS